MKQGTVTDCLPALLDLGPGELLDVTLRLPAGKLVNLVRQVDPATPITWDRADVDIPDGVRVGPPIEPGQA